MVRLLFLSFGGTDSLAVAFPKSGAASTRVPQCGLVVLLAGCLPTRAGGGGGEP